MADKKNNSGLADIRAVKVNPNLPEPERLVEYVRQMGGSPAHYKCGKFTIIEKHPSTGPKLEDCLRGMMA